MFSIQFLIAVDTMTSAADESDVFHATIYSLATLLQFTEGMFLQKKNKHINALPETLHMLDPRVSAIMTFAFAGENHFSLL